jgi:TonB family protein
MIAGEVLAQVEGMFDAIPEEKRRVGYFVGLSLLAHVAVFALVRVTYPPETTAWNLPLTVTVEGVTDTPSESEASNAFWDSVLDPSQIILPQTRVADPTPMSWQMNPRPIEVEASGTTLALVDDSESLPAGLAPLAVRLRQALVPERPVFRYPALRRDEPKPKTLVQWSENLQGRWKGEPPVLPGVPANLLSEAGPTVLRVAVLGSGQVGTVLILSSSGKNEMDTRAVEAVRRIRFEPREGSSLQWGGATIFWAVADEAPNPSTPPSP